MAVFEEESETFQGKNYRDHLNRNWDNGNNELDALNKRINNAGGSAQSDEVANARTDLHGVTYKALASREDATQATAESAYKIANSKADLNDTNEKISQILSGSPKGVYSSISDMTTAYPNGISGVLINSTDGNWYYWNGSTWAPGGKYQGIGLSNGSVENKNLGLNVPKFSFGKNLFNKETVTDGYFIAPNGSLRANTNYWASDFIEVTPNTNYAQSNDTIVSFFDSNKTVIEQHLIGTGYQNFKTPTNAFYVRISGSKPSPNNTSIDSYQLEAGTESTSYESFIAKINEKNLYDSVNNLAIQDESIDETKTDFITNSENLYNSHKITEGVYLNGILGLVQNSNYNTTDYIKVTPGTSYIFTNNRYTAFYDRFKKPLSYVENVSNNLITVPSNAIYMRASFSVSWTNFGIYLGTKLPDNILPYGAHLKGYIRVKASQIETTFKAFLPQQVCIAVGRTIELYNKQVCFTGNIENYHFQWLCDIGKNMKRKWSCTATNSMIGDHNLILNVYDNEMNLVTSIQTTIKIVNFSITSNKKILAIGDSLTNGKLWLSEIYNNLSNKKISFIGTRWNGDSAGQGGPLNHEGRSGVSAAWYLNNSTYDFESNGVGTNNPFWNPSTNTFDYSYYKSNSGISPDAIQIYLGTNGIELDPTANVSNIKNIVDKIRAVDSSIPVFVVFTLYRGDQNGIANQNNSDGFTSSSGSAWKLQEDYKVYSLMVALYSALNGYSNLHFVPVSLTHDSEFNFRDTVAVPVNPRSTIAEYEDFQATHPSQQDTGWLQMADIMFSEFSGYLS